MKQIYFRTEGKNERMEKESHRKRLPESCRQWLETEGDVDDFIFYQSESRVSQR